MKDMLLPTNLHRIERIVRIVAGLGILSLVFLGPQSAWGLLGIIPLATGLAGSCPLYTVLGIGTYRWRRHESSAAAPAVAIPVPVRKDAPSRRAA